jgi:hypothetical protein
MTVTFLMVKVDSIIQIAMALSGVIKVEAQFHLNILAIVNSPQTFGQLENSGVRIMWKWIKILYATLMEFFHKYNEIKVEETKERKEHIEIIQKEVEDEIKEQHKEVVNSANPNDTVDDQLHDLDLVK